MGAIEGTELLVGVVEGETVGINVGRLGIVGFAVGDEVGIKEGEVVGIGLRTSRMVGLILGDGVGTIVGCFV